MSPQDDDQHRDLLNEVPFQPVFIMGDHRSGTTLLYQLLANTQCFNVVTAYHVIRYGEILHNHVLGRTADAKKELAEEFRRLGLTDRLIDGVAVTPDLPEEYGFVIDSSRRPAITPENLPKFIDLCRKVQITGDPRKPILLKNPWDISGFAYVKQCFPNCRFVFLHRHPLAVIHSQLQAIRSIVGVKNPYLGLISEGYASLRRRPLRLAALKLMSSERLGLLEKSVARHVAEVASYFLANIGGLRESDYRSVRYEDLCADPDAVIQRIMQFLQIEFQASGYRRLIQARSPKPSLEARRAFDRAHAKVEPLLVACSYDAEPPVVSTAPAERNDR